ncbi:ATP-binding protein [Streptomyces sp. NBC_00838]|uniref:sensor histidine kinase n=1 Tax=Streptomyces sp. NBC_00838 TaxID=2903680 RepID=UPI003868AEA9|nr:ATP-binding protein [Streptomyces sp. NBC_00838]
MTGDADEGAETAEVRGSGERLLNVTVERYGVWLRSAVVGLCGPLGIVAADSTEIFPALSLLVPALIACGIRLYGLRHPLPLSLLGASDASVVVLTGLSQPVLGGAGANVMVEAIVAICAITFQQEWAVRPVAGAGLAALGAAACALGDVLSSPGHLAEPAPLVRLLFVAGLSRAAYVVVRTRVRAADRAAALRAAARREAAVAAARRATEREYLATLHDTASATLLMVSQGVGRDWAWLAPRARQDLEALSTVPGFETGRVDLAELLGCVTGGEGRAMVRLRTRVEGPLTVPSGPGLAIFNGVREAVTNVARHAGVREAELTAWAEADGAVVELSDAGRGFDPESVSARRRGISGSIIGRMQAVGGSATVTSRPGTGTRVRWNWHARPRTSQESELSQASRAGDGAHVKRVPRTPPAAAQPTVAGRLIRGQLLHGAQLAALLISLLSQFTLSLNQLTTYQSVYRPAWAQTAAFVCLTVVAATGATFLLRGRPIPPRVRGWGLAAVLSASATCAFTLPPERLTGAEDWAFGLVGWHALYLLADLRVRVFAAFLGVHMGLNATAVLLLGAPDAAEVAAMGIAAVSNCGFQLSVGVLTRLLHGAALTAGTAAAREEELRTRERVHADMQRDHKERYRALTATTVPLLVGLGHGVLSPHDDEVRLRCGVEAARMRRLFAESDAVLDPLLNELRACVEVAEHQGATVSLAVRGRRGEVPVEIRRELIDPVAVVMSGTRSVARVTVVWTPRSVRVSVIGEGRTDGGGLSEEAARAHGRDMDAKVTVTRTARGGSLWVEASWTRPTTKGVDPV